MYAGLPGIDSEHSQKTWESVYVWKWLVKSTRIKSIYFRIIERCTHLPVEIPSTPKKEDNRCVYEGKNAFLWLPTGFGKLVGYKMLSCVLDHKQSELGTGLSSYAVALLVLPLVSLTIATFNSLSEHYFVIAYLLALYIYYFRISCPHTISCGQAIVKMAMHVQAVDTRLFLSFHVAWVQGYVIHCCTCEY